MHPVPLGNMAARGVCLFAPRVCGQRLTVPAAPAPSAGRPGLRTKSCTGHKTGTLVTGRSWQQHRVIPSVPLLACTVALPACTERCLPRRAMSRGVNVPSLAPGRRRKRCHQVCTCIHFCTGPGSSLGPAQRLCQLVCSQTQEGQAGSCPCLLCGLPGRPRPGFSEARLGKQRPPAQEGQDTWERSGAPSMGSLQETL